MALFEKEHFKKPISIGLSEYLKKYTDSSDRADVATNTGVGTSTIRDVASRNNHLTENNSIAIIELMHIAIKNCERNIIKSTKAKQELEGMLK